VFLPAGKPAFDGWGTLLLVLHRGADGKWRLRREMWNEAQPEDLPGEK
jgi:ketosteroid isomerase-like protein